MLHHVGDDNGYVVGSASAQRQFDQAVRTLADICELERFGDGLVTDGVGESVGTQQVAVADAGFPNGQRRFNLVAGQRPHDQRTLRVGVRLLRGDPTLVDEGLDEGVVLGDLRQFAIAQQIPAGVTDVNQAEPVTGEEDRSERGPHPIEVGVQVDLLRDSRIAFVHGIFELAEQVAAGFVVVEVRQRRDNQLRRHLTGSVSAHAVGEGQQPGPGVDGVLVVRAHQPAIGACGVAKGQCHGRSSITVLPMCTGVPIGTRTAVVTFERSR